MTRRISRFFVPPTPHHQLQNRPNLSYPLPIVDSEHPNVSLITSIPFPFFPLTLFRDFLRVL